MLHFAHPLSPRLVGAAEWIEPHRTSRMDVTVQVAGQHHPDLRGYHQGGIRPLLQIVVPWYI